MVSSEKATAAQLTVFIVELGWVGGRGRGLNGSSDDDPFLMSLLNRIVIGIRCHAAKEWNPRILVSTYISTFLEAWSVRFNQM